MAEKHKYGLLGRLNVEDLTNAFMGLEQKEQTIAVMVGVLVFILLLVLPISCASSKLSGLQTDYQKQKKETADLMAKLSEYQTSKGKLEALKVSLKGGGGDSLSTVMESLANEAGIGPNIEKLRPVNLESNDYYDEVGVDAIVSKVSLSQATDYLTKIVQYTKAPLRIKKLQMKPRYENRSLLNLTFEVSTIQVKGDAGE